MRKLLLTLLLLCVSPALLWSADITVTNADITGTVNWTNDNTYYLDGLVFVEDGEVLNIEAGTVIKGMEVPSSDFASALIVARGGQIFANGTASQRILFTTDAEDTGPLDAFDRGLWGGLIILGRATINTSAGEGFIEGIPTGLPGEYGDAGLNFDDNDNSGSLSYVVIRHGGAELEPDEEINGLTLGAVGAGTVIDHVEVYANLDDGIEWFGGTVRIKYATVAFVGDDSYDYDEGFNGSGQYFFTVQDNAGDHAGEHDGGTTPEDGLPYAIPRFSNVTYMGAGECNLNTSKNPYCFKIRDNAGGKWYNSIFADHANAGITIEDLGAGVEDSEQRLADGDIEFENNLWYGFGDGNTWSSIAPDAYVANYLANVSTDEILNPGIRGTGRIPGGNALDPRPVATGPADGKFVNVPDDSLNFFDDNVGYVGAFDPNDDMWIRGWTTLDDYDFLVPTDGPGGTVTVTYADVKAKGSYAFFANTTYKLDGLVFFDSGAVAYIEPGTKIMGMEVPSLDFASAMIISRCGHIYAMGTETAPVLFTTDAEEFAPADAFDRGLWGGLIVLGDATINTSAGEGFIEGIPTGFPGEYGDAGKNFDDNHSAGHLHYVKIRHGGAELEPDEEINGLTLGAVGAGTQIDHVEVYANLDDGIEWFGGTVRIKYAVVGFCADDSYDYDEGFNGSGQYFFTIADDLGDHSGEHDGGTTPEDGLPYAIPRFANVTYMGAGETSGSLKNPYCFKIRDNAGGKWYNSIFVDHANAGITIEDLGAGVEDSEQRLADGDIEFENNLWYGFGDGNTWAAIAPETYVATYLSGTGTNNIADPQLRGISRDPVAGGLDPVPQSGSPAATAGGTVPDDSLDFFEDTPYAGAFDPSLKTDHWMRDWTTLEDYGYFAGGVICDCLPGDANNDAQQNVGDAVYLINYVFKQGTPPAPYATCSGDANGDCQANVGDAVYLINYVFKQGPPPPTCDEWLNGGGVFTGCGTLEK